MKKINLKSTLLSNILDITNYTLIIVLIVLLFVDTIDFSTLMGFPKSANETMFNIIALLNEMSILLIFVLFGVLITLAYIIDVFNANSNPFPRHFEKTVESTLDVLFVIFPTILIIYLLIPSLGFIFNNEITVETMFEIDVIGHQWYWSYEYHLSIGTSLYNIFENENICFNTIEFDSLMNTETTYNRLLQVDKRVIIPVDTYIKINITSQDVIHSWAIPQLGIKYDAIPGRLISCILSSNALGIYYGQCSELCGVNHGFMPICIQAIENDIFLDWVLITLDINPSKIIIENNIVNNINDYNEDTTITQWMFKKIVEKENIKKRDSESPSLEAPFERINIFELSQQFDTTPPKVPTVSEWIEEYLKRQEEKQKLIEEELVWQRKQERSRIRFENIDQNNNNTFLYPNNTLSQSQSNSNSLEITNNKITDTNKYEKPNTDSSIINEPKSIIHTSIKMISNIIIKILEYILK